MPTKKPHFSIILETDMLDRVLDYKEKNRFSSQSKAIQKLIEIGINDVSDSPPPLKSFLAADEAQLVSDYRELSPPGKEYIRQTMAMAKQSWAGKNETVSDLEAAK